MSNPQAKPPSVFAIFDWRMEAEGRTEEYKAKYREIKARTGKKHGPAMWELLKTCPEFGYTTPKAEQAWFEAHREKVILGERRAKTAEKVRRHRAKKREEEAVKVFRSDEEKFVAAVSHLPATASYELEFDWFRSHPAMMRRALRSGDEKGRVEVTVEDILASPNGPPPSQAAAYLLVNVANAPLQMMKEVLVRMMKAAAVEGGKAVADPDGPGEFDGCDDDGIREAEEHLRRIREQLDSAS